MSTGAPEMVPVSTMTPPGDTNMSGGTTEATTLISTLGTTSGTLVLQQDQNSTTPDSSVVTTALSSTVDWSESWPYLLLSVIVMLAVVSNIYAMVLTVCKRRLHYTTCYLLTSLACVNLLHAVLVMPVSIATNILNDFALSDYLCDIWQGIGLYVLASNCIHICASALDCFLRMGFPVQHKQIDGALYVLLMVLGTWLLSAACSVPFTINILQSDTGKMIRHIDDCRLRNQKTYLWSGLLPSYYIWIPAIGVIYVLLLCVMNKRRNDAVALQTENSFYGNGHVQSITMNGIGNGKQTPSNGVNHNSTDTSNQNGHANKDDDPFTDVHLESETPARCNTLSPINSNNGTMRRNRCNTIDSISASSEIDMMDPSAPNRCNTIAAKDCQGLDDDVIVAEQEEENKNKNGNCSAVQATIADSGTQTNGVAENLDDKDLEHERHRSDSDFSIDPVSTVATIVAQIHQPEPKSPQKAGKEQLNGPLDHDDVRLLSGDEEYQGIDNYSYEEQNPLTDLIQVKKPPEDKEQKDENTPEQTENEQQQDGNRLMCARTKERRSILKRENSAKQQTRKVQFAIPISESTILQDTRKIKRKPTGRYKNRNKKLTHNGGVVNRSFEYLTHGEMKSKHSANRLYRHKATVWLLCVMFVTYVLVSVPFYCVYSVLSACLSCHISKSVQLILEWLYYSHSFLNPMLYVVFHYNLKMSTLSQSTPDVSESDMDSQAGNNNSTSSVDNTSHN